MKTELIIGAIIWIALIIFIARFNYIISSRPKQSIDTDDWDDFVASCEEMLKDE